MFIPYATNTVWRRPDGHNDACDNTFQKQICVFDSIYISEIALSGASKLASAYFTLFYRSEHVLYTGICILGGCLCKVDSLSPRVAVTQLSVFNCRLESNICA